MKWSQHDNNQAADPRIWALIGTYGPEGYGVFIVVKEFIGRQFGPANLTLELEESTPQIVHFLQNKTPGDRVDAILKFCEDANLLDRGPNKRLRCLDVLHELDNATSANHAIKALIQQANIFRDKYCVGTTKQLRRGFMHIQDKQDIQKRPDQLTLAVVQDEGDIKLEIESIEKSLKNEFVKGTVVEEILKEKLINLVKELELCKTTPKKAEAV